MEAKTLELSDTPYPGLRPFRSDEADIFFGRERQTDDLLSRLAEHRFLAVVGPSGCGKSSLVAAGLMPALATGFMVTAGAHWRIAKLRPGERPLANLANALVEARILDDERIAHPDAPVFLEAALRRGPLGLAEILRGSKLAPDANVLVLIDQFEELFRFSAGMRRDDAEAFVALVLASAAAPRERIYIAITMRSDFLGECAPFHGLPEAINDGLYLAPRLTRDECAACITGPARVFGANVEPALVNRLLNDFGPDPDQLPLLQHALLRMWNRHDADRQSGANTILGVADYEAIGGLARSLSDHANEAFADLDPDGQRIAKRMFQRLSDSETARRDRRAPAHVQDIAELAGAAIDDVRRVADMFRRRDRCFLMPRDGIELTPDTMLDISHESLLRQWDRAVGWIEEEAEAVAAYQRLRNAARGWQDGEALLAGGSLERALAWRSTATAVWARRYASEDDFRAVCDFIAAGEQQREARRQHEVRARSVQLRRSIATIALGALTVAGVVAWVVWPLCYRWEHTSCYASHGRRNGAPYGLRELSREEVRHRPVSYRIVTAGRFGRVLRMDAVNSRDELTEVIPDYHDIKRGRHLTTSRWRYEYDDSGRIASEHQYNRRGELVQGKIYVSSDADESRRAVFIDANGTPTPVQGMNKESANTPAYYWAEELASSMTSQGEVETSRYLGLTGEPATNGDRAFATRRVYDDRGYEVSVTSLDASGQPMNDAYGNSMAVMKRDQSGNQVELVLLDSKGHRTRGLSGWAIQRAKFDSFGNHVEDAFFDENDRPTIIDENYHRVRIRLDEHGSVAEMRYFDHNDQPTSDGSGCYGNKQQHDSLDRQTRWTCTDATGAPRKSRYGIVSWISHYDERGRIMEETTLDADDHPIAGQNAVATTISRYDNHDRLAEVSFRGANGEPVTNGDGYAGSITTFDDASNTELTKFVGVDGQPATVKDGYARIERRRDVWSNVTEEHYGDEHGSPRITSDGSAGWRGTFDARGQEVERVLLGKTGEIVLAKDGVAGWRTEYDGLGRNTSIQYRDVMGNPVVNVSDGVAGWNARYDACGRKVELGYIGLDGKPAHSIHGAAGWRAEYDSRGNQTRREYVDTKGAPTLDAWEDNARFTGTGYALLKRTFDAHGQVIEEGYFDAHEERVARSGSWSYVTYTYDDSGHETRMSYFGAQGEPVKSDWYHTAAWTFDGQGNAVEHRYFDTDDKTPVASNEGFARAVRRYDQDRHIVDEKIFGTHDERVTYTDGSHHNMFTWDNHGRKTREELWGSGEPPNKLGAIEYRYDRWGNLVEQRHLDANEQLVVTPAHRCAILRWRYSDRQELLEQMCMDPRDTLLPALPNGAARIVYSYGRPGEKIREAYYDESGRPFTTEERFAGIKYKVDLLGRVAEITYIDARDNQVVTTFNYARVVYTYDARGAQIEGAYFLANDTPMVPVAKEESEFDALGRKVLARYLGPGGKPASLFWRGQHVTLHDYDDYGNVHALHYLDARGRPTRGYAREFDQSWQLCFRWLARYDEHGQRIGNGECQQRLPADDDRAHDHAPNAARGAIGAR